MPHENFVFDRHAFTDKTVTGNFAATPNFSAFLHFDKCANLGVVANLATIQVRESVKDHSLPQLDAGGDLRLELWRFHLACGSAQRRGSTAPVLAVLANNMTIAVAIAISMMAVAIRLPVAVGVGGGLNMDR